MIARHLLVCGLLVLLGGCGSPGGPAKPPSGAKDPNSPPAPATDKDRPKPTEVARDVVPGGLLFVSVEPQRPSLKVTCHSSGKRVNLAVVADKDFDDAKVALRDGNPPPGALGSSMGKANPTLYADVEGKEKVHVIVHNSTDASVKVRLRVEQE
jgi:hypothetical protein